MVSFTCSFCQDVLKKPAVPRHALHNCRGANFTCVDCMQVFNIESIKTHTSCVTETEKYQGKWQQRQKYYNNNNNNNNNNDSDSDNNKREPLHPPRAPMHLMDTDSSDDEDWVKSKKKTTKKEINIKNNNNNNNNDNNKEKALSESPTNKRPRDASPLTTSSPPNNNNINNNKKNKSDNNNNNNNNNNNTLILPRAVTAADCIAPSFVLGTDEEIAEIAKCILNDAGIQQLTLRELSKRMVERYNARIAKNVRYAVESAIRNGKLREKEGHVMMN